MVKKEKNKQVVKEEKKLSETDKLLAEATPEDIEKMAIHDACMREGFDKE